MTQEEKHLLLKDLCGRLPYGVKITDGLHIATLKVRIDTAPATLAQFIHSDGLKYYLRPMSSMTEEEKKEFNKLIGGENTNWHLFDENRIAHCKSFYSVFCYFSTMGKIIDFFNLHHLDYRGLIPMGLALEAPEGMYNIK